MKKLRFKSVEEYYAYHSQGHTFAPRFDDLVASAKSYWVNEFKKYKQKGDL